MDCPFNVRVISPLPCSVLCHDYKLGKISLKLFEFHLPHLQTSSLDIKVGWLEIAAGMPALNEWPEIFSAFLPRCLCMRERMELLKRLVDKNSPESKVNTGRFSFTSRDFLSRRFSKQEYVQREELLMAKRSMKSLLHLLLIFGNLTWIVAISGIDKLIQSHVKVSVQKECSFFERISPILKEPKKATQQAAQKTLLLSVDQLLQAISWPRIFRSGRVMTVPYHGGGRSKKINAWYLNTHMVYL